VVDLLSDSDEDTSPPAPPADDSSDIEFVGTARVAVPPLMPTRTRSGGAVATGLGRGRRNGKGTAARGGPAVRPPPATKRGVTKSRRGGFKGRMSKAAAAAAIAAALSEGQGGGASGSSAASSNPTAANAVAPAVQRTSIPSNLLSATANLTGATHVLAVDADNFSRLLLILPAGLTPTVVVLVFYGGSNRLRVPHPVPTGLAAALQRGRLQFYEAGVRHDAADFRLVLTLGGLNARLAQDVGFTILSGDRGFTEVVPAIGTVRKVSVFNPHHKTHARVMAFLNGL